MKTIQSIFDNITLDECSFRNEFLTVEESSYKGFVLSFEYNLCDNGFVSLSLFKGETEIVPSLKQQNNLVVVINELQKNYLENDKEYNKQYKEHLSSICESAYFIN